MSSHNFIKGNKLTKDMGIAGFHLPQASPISPSMIDPSLIPQTYESVVHFYNANKAILTQLWTENERYLYVWGTHFNRSMNPQYVREANSVMQGGPGGAVGERREGFSRDQARSSFNAPNRPSQLLQVENVDSRSRVAPVTTGRPAGSSGSVFQFPTSYIRSTRPDLAGHEASNGHGNPREQGTKPAKVDESSFVGLCQMLMYLFSRRLPRARPIQGHGLSDIEKKSRRQICRHRL